MNHLSPYPNQGEILRFLAVALDLKAGNKYIDEYARNGLLSSYLHLVKTLSLAGLPRSISLPLLASYCFSWYATDFFYQFESVVAGPQTLACLVIPGYSAIRAAVQWLERNVEGWSTSHEKWSKEQKDRLTVWCKGTELPSYSYIMTLPDWLKEGGAVIDRA
ncbi:MAG: hypothetical protein HRT35_29440, partial [Algicola sp.]|nr:hypothetical protein [Algicola sp.]